MPDKLFPTFLVLLFLFALRQNGNAQIIIPISNGLNDVEERADNSMYTNSTDIELVNDGDDQTVGLRFENLQLPQGMQIAEAWIQFTTDEASTGTCSLEIRAEATADAPPFEDVFSNVSSRPLTTASVSWQPVDWEIIGQASIPQRTPNLAEVLQEVIGQPGWESGNAVVFVITGTGRRTAAAYENYPSWAARLVIEIDFLLPTEVLEGVVINELMPANGLVTDDFGEVEDWVEIYNGSDQVIDLNGLYLTDDASDLQKWQIAGNQLIAPGGFGLLWLDGDEEQGGLHAPFKLNREGEFLALSQELNGQLHTLDSFEFPETPFNISYGRLEDGQDEWVFFSGITPNESNNGSERFLDAEVEFSHEGGIYSGIISFQMFVDDPDATIFYTLDGSNPTMASTEYTGGFNLNGIKLVRARAFKPGFGSGRITTDHFFVNPEHSLPIVCVQTEPDNLWDDEIGIHVIGTNGVPGYCNDFPRNWNQDWERPANVTLFEPDGTKGFQVNCGIKIGGGCSRAFKAKSFNIYMRGSRYEDKSIEYQVFPGLDIQEFKRLKLRNGGNDWEQMIFRDGMNHTILQHTVDIDLMAYRPTVVYLNGGYWGVFGIRELFNEDYVASHHGVDDDSLDIITNPQVPWAEVTEGDYDAFEAIRVFIESNDLSVQSNYEFLLPLIDMNEYINYHIAQIYLANYDWPANNVRVWRDRNNGKFRWMLYDLDATTNYGQGWSQSYAYTNTLAHATATNGPAWPNGPESTLFLRKLLENEGFRNEFVQRTATYRTLFFNHERINPMVDSIRQMLEPEMEQHIDNWVPNMPQWGGGWPSGGSVAAWNGFINNYKSFFQQRRNYILNHFNNTLDLDGDYELTFVYPPETPGDLYLHSNEVKIPHGFETDYFKNIPLKVKAVAHPGYQFVKWLETGETNPEIEFEANANTTLTPLFARIAPILTEIHYHPAEGEEYEFLEFFNPVDEPLLLGGYYFSEGVEFEFPAGTVLSPGEYLLLVKDESKYATMGCQVFEWASGDLDDAGETIELLNSQGMVEERVTYASSSPWSTEPGGNGPSLTLISSYSDNGLPQNWIASSFQGGSPCDSGIPTSAGEEGRHFDLKIYPNPASDHLTFEYTTLDSKSIPLEIFNALGQPAFEVNLPPTSFMSKEKMELANWPAGVYFIRLKGKKQVLAKFVKE